MDSETDSVNRDCWARLAGLLYLLTNATAIVGFWVRGRLIVRGDATATAANIIGSESLFRFGIACELVTVAGVIALVVALYRLLAPVERDLALLAAFWRLAENIVLAVITFSSFTLLALLGDGDYLQAVPADMRAALAYTFLKVHNAGFQVGFLFLGLGSALFALLWWRSRLIPRPLAGLGIIASLIMAVAALVYMVAPAIMGAVSLAYMAPMGLFEIGLGLWLLVRGLPRQA